MFAHMRHADGLTADPQNGNLDGILDGIDQLVDGETGDPDIVRLLFAFRLRESVRNAASIVFVSSSFNVASFKFLLATSIDHSTSKAWLLARIKVSNS